ncbi:MAG: hypothetical protein ACE5I5_17885 [Candidatus Heimdallarchaeota archaeon]
MTYVVKEQLALFQNKELRLNEKLLENLPKIEPKFYDTAGLIPSYLLEIDYTIPELAYLTHNFYRYYGKYPSVLGGFLIDEFAGQGPVFDNYLGSGTTLVEAKIRGISSTGIDINPIAVLASNVKTRNYFNIDKLRNYLENVLYGAKKIERINQGIVPNWKYLTKWFSDENIQKLARIKQAMLANPRDEYREFATICFLSIIRRCSNAYDGEVRPHVNPKKNPRDPFQAFKDKYIDMLEREEVFTNATNPEIVAEAYCTSNTETDLKQYMPFGNPTLVISHPPYLNCFNYYAVFNLENYWSQNIDEATQGRSQEWIRKNEHICWPATKSSVIDDYFLNLQQAYTVLRNNIDKGAILAIVIGDSTLRKQLIPVHKRLLEILPKCGFEPFRIYYRTTHYGIGKYAYRKRADYHGDAVKKDGVIVVEAI